MDINKTELYEATRRRLRKKENLALIRELFIFILFLWILFIVVFSNKALNSFKYTENFRKMFTSPGFNDVILFLILKIRANKWQKVEIF